MEGKALIQSKNFWLAVIQAVIGVMVVFSTAYPTVGGLLIAKSVLDILLRIITEAPIFGVFSSK